MMILRKGRCLQNIRRYNIHLDLYPSLLIDRLQQEKIGHCSIHELLMKVKSLELD